MIKEKFIVNVCRGLWDDPWPKYFDNFWNHCLAIGHENEWQTITVANYQLRPLGGKLIITNTQGWYLRWNSEASHTAFVLTWAS